MNAPEETTASWPRCSVTRPTGLEPDVAELVAGGVARGRDRRDAVGTVGTALGAVAMGVVGGRAGRRPRAR